MSAAVRALVARHAQSPEEESELLAMLGLVETPARPRTVVVRPHERHGRAHYVPGCQRCRQANAAYIRTWRQRRAHARPRPAVTPAPMLVPVQLTLPLEFAP